MKLHKIAAFSLFFISLCIQPTIAYANNSPKPNDAMEAVEKYIAELVDLLQHTKLSEDNQEANQQVHQLLEENFIKVVDFKRIVKRIMGKHFAKANKEQRNQFLDVFKQSLVRSYGKFIINTDLQVLANKLQYQVLPVGKSRQKGRANVTVVFKVDDKSYEAVHAMKYNSSSKLWLLENLVVEGINLGINYRSQFDRMMTRNKNDYDKVISEWSGADQKRLENGQG